MEDKQCKQTERYSVMAKGSDCFLSLDDKSKQRYKVKINNIQGYDLYQIKKEKLSGSISKFPNSKINLIKKEIISIGAIISVSVIVA